MFYLSVFYLPFVQQLAKQYERRTEVVVWFREMMSATMCLCYCC